jgi:Ca2+-binding EF-hand superfamily protein
MSTLRPVPVLLVALAFALPSAHAQGPSLTLPDDVFARPPAGDAVDLLLIGNGRAAVVRVHIRVGAHSFRKSWADFAVRLHAFLDRDGDRVLTLAEATKVPLPSLFLNVSLGIPAIQPGMVIAPIDADPKDGKISIDELLNYLRGPQESDPLTQPGAAGDPRTQGVFEHLDKNGDALLTPAELAQADALLGALDRDEDETLSVDELSVPRSAMSEQLQFGNATVRQFDPSKSRIIPLTSAESRASAARRLLDALEKSTRRKIGPEPLGAEPDAFKAADVDRDGLLDHGELAGYLASPTAQLELAIDLPPTRTGSGRIKSVPAPSGSSSAGRPSTRYLPGGGLLVEFAGVEIEFLATEFPSRAIDLVRLIEPRVQAADSNKDGAVDEQEASGDAVLKRIHPAADRNGDGKMTGPEARFYLELNDAAEEARITLTVAEQGTALYDRLDADRDSRFTIRELRAAASSLAGLDGDHDGRISLAEIPGRTQLNISRGASPTRNRRAVAPPPAPLTLGSRGNLPAWFVGMDRNRDGDVSAREFLGTADQFRRFDADRDGLIHGDEASRSR